MTFSTSALTLGAAILAALAGSASVAAQTLTADETCKVWSNFAETAAKKRDNGMKFAEQSKKVDATMKHSTSFNNADRQAANGILKLVYNDFRTVTPEEIGQSMYTGCVQAAD